MKCYQCNSKMIRVCRRTEKVDLTKHAIIEEYNCPECGAWDEKSKIIRDKK